ncbi:MAG: protein translocase subunit SecD [bacterium]|nr:protein translocase subunit SecD [bacterium]
MWKKRVSAIVLIVLAAFVGYFAYDAKSEDGTVSKHPYRLGLDLSGGSHLVFRADTSEISGDQIDDAMRSLADVVERRVNLFGVSEPVVQVEKGGVVGRDEHRLIVELPGVTDVDEAIALIGKTPLLDFKLIRPEVANMTPEQMDSATVEELFVSSGLTGRYLQRAQIQFDQTTNVPVVSLVWNDEGRALFAAITRDNIGEVLGVFLDGQPITTPVIQQEISTGEAIITGNFNIQEARQLVRDLNYGALPVPIELVSTQTIGASLGAGALDASVFAGLIAFVVVAIFLIVWYRIPGVIAIIALAIYVALSLALFKLIPVTLTAAGIAGFVLTLGMAVDANILIFERMKEELRRGKVLNDAVREGFQRAWLSIRDSNLSSIITAVILYYFASTPVVKGFALVFGIGVVVSMFTAITASRTLLMAVGAKGDSKVARFFFGSGITF